MEQKPNLSSETIPAEILRNFNNGIKQAILKHPNLATKPQKFPNGEIYIKHQMVKEGKDVNIVGHGLGEDSGEIVKYNSGIYLVKLKTGEYVGLMEEQLDLLH